MGPPAGAPRATVLGAGVAGLCAAVSLQEAGFAVEIRDPCAAPGGGASGAAGGMLAPFCEGETAPPAVVTLGAGALDWWAERHAPTHRNGTLVVAPGRDRGELDRFARRTAGHRRLDAAGVAALEPDLAGRFAEGLFFTGEGHLDPSAALRSLVARLEDGGARLFLADGLPAPSSSDGLVVDATGIAAATALPDLRAVRGETVVVRAPDVRLSRPVRLLHPRIPVYLVPRDDGRIMIGATTIESADGAAPRVRSVVDLLNAAYAVHPAFAEAEIVGLRAGLRPAFPDNLPRALVADGVVHANGLYRHGFLLGPWLGGEVVKLARELTEGRTDADRPQRRRA